MSQGGTLDAAKVLAPEVRQIAEDMSIAYGLEPSIACTESLHRR